MIYIMRGQDTASKEIQLKKLKEKTYASGGKDFNLDIVYGKDAGLIELQKMLLSFPVNSEKRMLLIKDAGQLKDELKSFLLEYAGKPNPGLELVFDFDYIKEKDDFFDKMSPYSQVFRFKEERKITAFDLSRRLNEKNAPSSLKILNQLLKDGQRPELIMGALRSSWERYSPQPQELHKKLDLLLTCDIEIKQGRLKPAFALEKLIVNLCNLTDA